MKDFNLRKYLAENKLIKEGIESFLDEDVNWNWNKARDYFDDDEKVVYKVWGEGNNYNYYANYALPLDSNDIKDEKMRESGGFTYISKWTKDTDELVDEENLSFYINENKLLKEDNFEEAVESIEISLMGMSPSVAANAIVRALRSSYGSNATKVGLEINKIMKLR